jgi:hypothetical protein
VELVEVSDAGARTGVSDGLLELVGRDLLVVDQVLGLEFPRCRKEGSLADSRIGDTRRFCERCKAKRRLPFSNEDTHF